MALGRSRFRQHDIIYTQYVRKMGCFVEALEAITRADRGRASEPVQARKSLQQADLQQPQAQSQARQIDVRLRPQDSWTVTGGARAGAGGNVGTTKAADYSLGVSINLPLLSPGLAPATSSARERAAGASAQCA